MQKAHNWWISWRICNSRTWHKQLLQQKSQMLDAIGCPRIICWAWTHTFVNTGHRFSVRWTNRQVHSAIYDSAQIGLFTKSLLLNLFHSTSHYFNTDHRLSAYSTMQCRVPARDGVSYALSLLSLLSQFLITQLLDDPEAYQNRSQLVKN